MIICDSSLWYIYIYIYIYIYMTMWKTLLLQKNEHRTATRVDCCILWWFRKDLGRNLGRNLGRRNIVTNDRRTKMTSNGESLWRAAANRDDDSRRIKMTSGSKSRWRVTARIKTTTNRESQHEGQKWIEMAGNGQWTIGAAAYLVDKEWQQHI